MNETMAYAVCGIFLYAAGYLSVGLISEKLWEIWAWKRVGQFWEYGVKKGYAVYYPGLVWFLRWHNRAYTVIRCLFWPVAIPVQMVLRTKVLTRLSEQKYY